MKMKKKELSERTKVVIRHLPPSLSQSDLFSQFDHLFAHRYNWFRFRHGKSSHKPQRHSRAYIDFKSSEDVLQFAAFFHGHMFVNEKGAQFKAIVEYAPSQCVPKTCRKDGREGTIYTDPDYLEFLKLIAKPVENLPSAEIQLERKEAVQAGLAEETPITTPLMEFVRQKRSAEGGARVSTASAKVRRRKMTASLSKPDPSTTKQGFEKEKYIPKGSIKKSKQKVVPGIEDQSAILCGKDIPHRKSGITLTSDSGKKKIPLIKGKGHEISPVSESMSQQSCQTSGIGNPPVLATLKPNQGRVASERMIKSILQNNEMCQKQSSKAVQPQQKRHNLKNDRQPHWPSAHQVGLYGDASNSEPPAFIIDAKLTSDDKLVKREFHGLDAAGDKGKKHTKNKNRRDHGHSLPHSDIQLANLEHLSSTKWQQSELHFDSVAGANRHSGHHLVAHNTKGIGSSGAASKRRGATGYAAQEKRVWVQKSSSGS